jgi:hypothetical protein
MTRAFLLIWIVFDFDRAHIQMAMSAFKLNHIPDWFSLWLSNVFDHSSVAQASN